jgi:hypothetical protein
MSRFALIVGTTLLCVGIACVAAGAWLRRGDERLLSAPATASAVIVAKEGGSAPPGQKVDYFIRYEFTAGDGRVIQGRARLDRRRWTDTAEGTPITVAYLPSDPSKNRLLEGGGTTSHRMVWAAGGAFLASGCAVMALSVFSRRRRRARRGSVVHRASRR